MKRRDFLAGGATIALPLVAGCFGRSFEVAETSQVGWKSFDFNPRYIHVGPGTTVTWINDESYNHTVTAASDNWDKDVNVPAGGKATHAFRGSGVYTAKCAEHGARMKIGVGDAKITEPIEE